MKREAMAMNPQELLGRLAAELEAATAISNECQDAVGEALGTRQGGLAGDVIEHLQRMDELTQRLADLASFVGLLAARGVEAPLDELLGGLRLSDVRARLAGGSAESSEHGEPEVW